MAGIATALGSRKFLSAAEVEARESRLTKGHAENLASAYGTGAARRLIPHVNHIGYRPGAGKFVVIEELPGAEEWQIVQIHKKGWAPVFTGKLTRAGNDFGPSRLGDFSSLREPGIYRVSVPFNNPVPGKENLAAWSYDFAIGERVWDDPIRQLVNYFRVQACGPSRHGYNSPCHMGKIERDDNGEAVPITGGWHSAHDCLRDTAETLHGMRALLALASSRPDLEEELDLFNEIRWGNDYFLSIQSPEGYLRFGVYGKHYYDYEKYDWWDTSSYILITRPAALVFQHNFIAVQSMMARLYRQSHPEYAARCLEAGRKCFDWVRRQKGGTWGAELTSYELGTGILAGVEMFRATGDAQYRSFASSLANQLVTLQQEAGFFAERQGPDLQSEGDYDLPVVRAVYAPLAQLGLCAAVRWLVGDDDRLRWKASLERYASFVKDCSEANAFGIMPYRVYRGQPPGYARTRGGLRYRYFVEPGNKAVTLFYSPIYWETGNNALAAGNGVVMAWMAEILGQPWLAKLCQRQLDWIVGANPFDASMILAVGRNQPVSYRALEMVPDVPDINGAVMQGPLGTPEDEPLIVSSYWATAEFWMPHQAAVTWLVAEVSALR